MAADNPFVDPNPSFEDNGRTSTSPADGTLALGRNVSLSLGTDSLIVLGELRVDKGDRDRVAKGFDR